MHTQLALDIAAPDALDLGPDPDSGLSCVRCNHCNTYLTVHEARVMLHSYIHKHTHCGATVNIDLDTTCAIDPRCVRLLTSPSAVYYTTFYHCTKNPKWEELQEFSTADRPAVHIGTREAAMDRYSENLANMGYDFFLYTLRVRTRSKICRDIWFDDNFWPEDAANLPGVVRYINRYESPGSVSLLVDPADLVITNRVEL